jgi:hypothetical protein
MPHTLAANKRMQSQARCLENNRLSGFDILRRNGNTTASECGRIVRDFQKEFSEVLKDLHINATEGKLTAFPCLCVYVCMYPNNLGNPTSFPLHNLMSIMYISLGKWKMLK